MLRLYSAHTHTHTPYISSIHIVFIYLCVYVCREGSCYLLLVCACSNESAGNSWPAGPVMPKEQLENVESINGLVKAVRGEGNVNKLFVSSLVAKLNNAQTTSFFPYSTNKACYPIMLSNYKAKTFEVPDFLNLIELITSISRKYNSPRRAKPIKIR